MTGHRVRRLALGLLVALVAAGLRLAWPNWDGGHHLHPDERFLGMVAAAVELPENLPEYLDTRRSPLNPANRGFPFFVYGDLPLLAVRAAAEAVGGRPQATAVASPGADATTVPAAGGRLAADLQGVTRIGRLLSALADLATLAWLYLLGRRLWGEAVGLTAAALGAVTVLHIQQAHFATVDALGTQFAVAALALAVGAAQRGGTGSLVATGVAAALAAACRLNLAPALGLVPLAAVAYLERPTDDGPPRRRPAAVLLSAVVALVTAAAIFRLAMPYAFDGVVALDPRWVDSIQRIRHMLSGADDGGPPGVQWAGRTPLVFALRNMVVWGMGVPLGLAAWLAWGFFLVSRLRSAWRHDGPPPPLLDGAAIVWLWPTLLVGWFGSQRVMSMRYLLPAYPALLVLAAWLLTRPWVAGDGAPATGWRRSGRLALPLVLVATTAWAWAFTSVYRHPHTRIAASRWLFREVPGEAVLTVRGDAGRRTLGVMPLAVEGRPASVLAFQPDSDVALESLVLPGIALAGTAGNSQPGWVRVRVGPAPDGAAAIVDTAVEAGGGRRRIDLQGATVAGGSLEFVVLDGMTPDTVATLAKPVVVGEHWDDQLPLAVDGEQPARRFELLQLGSFDPDGPAKLEHLVDRLAAADLVVLSSNRGYAAIPRRPDRWPLTTRFYRLLLGGELGFEVAAVFTSFPQLGRLRFPDSEGGEVLGLVPDPLRPRAPGVWNVPLPPAEEAFSVYDHPRVVVLRKTAGFDAKVVQRELAPGLTTKG